MYTRIFKKCTEKNTHIVFEGNLLMYGIIPDYSLSFKVNLFYIYMYTWTTTITQQEYSYLTTWTINVAGWGPEIKHIVSCVGNNLISIGSTDMSKAASSNYMYFIYILVLP